MHCSIGPNEASILPIHSWDQTRPPFGLLVGRCLAITSHEPIILVNNSWIIDSLRNPNCVLWQRLIIRTALRIILKVQLWQSCGLCVILELLLFLSVCEWLTLLFFKFLVELRLFALSCDSVQEALCRWITCQRRWDYSSVKIWIHCAQHWVVRLMVDDLALRVVILMAWDALKLLEFLKLGRQAVIEAVACCFIFCSLVGRKGHFSWLFLRLALWSRFEQHDVPDWVSFLNLQSDLVLVTLLQFFNFRPEFSTYRLQSQVIRYVI